MTYHYWGYPQCTCGTPNQWTAPLPCPVHGYATVRTYPTTTTTSLYSTCRGRHCAHAPECYGTVWIKV